MKTKTFWFVIAAILFLSALMPPVVFADDMQYLGIHANDPFIEGRPETFNQAGINEIANTIGTRGRADRKLAVSFTINYFRQSIDFGVSNAVWTSLPRLLNQQFGFTVGGNYTTAAMKQALKNMLDASVATDVPLIIRIDGTQWWELRPDLWNWWNDQEAGYSPDNINNVERFDWGTSTGTAVKIGWRKWGGQFRVAPAPNLASLRYRAAQKECLDLLFPVIAEWYNGLPDDKKYLLGGIVLGWELSIWWNAFYYKDGNDLLNQTADNDPTNYPDLNPINPKPGDRRVIGLGYAAAQTLAARGLDIQTSGTITTATGDAICADYLEFLIELAVQHGIPLNRLITHSLGSNGGITGKAAVSDIEGVVPGWSWYGLSTGVSVTNLDGLINHADGRPWALIETGSGIRAGYETVAKIDQEALERVFAYRNNRYINLFNWNGGHPGHDNYGVQFQPDLIEAIRLTLWEEPGISVGAQSGSLSAGRAGFATFPVVAAGNIPVGTAITLNNISSVAGITLGTTATAGYNTTLTVRTTADTPEGVHSLTLTIDSLTSNSFSLVVGKGSLDDVKYYPNPIQPSKGLNYSRMQFSNIPAGTRIKIYTMLGQAVRDLKADASGMAVWDGKNNAGEKAASGVYIVYMEDGDGNKKRIKVAVER